MRRKLLGYRVQFSFGRFDPDAGTIRLSVDDGQKLQNTLAGEGLPAFVTFKSTGETFKTSTIERISPIYEELEEKCNFCYQLKTKVKACPRGCDEPKEKTLQELVDLKSKAKIGSKFRTKSKSPSISPGKNMTTN